MLVPDACYPRSHYVFLRYADSRNVLTVHIERWFALSNDVFRTRGRRLQKKVAAMKTRSHAADYYRRTLSAQPHALKRLNECAAILKCHRGQEIPNDSGPAGHWYYVITGAVRRCTIRSDGRRQIVDLMLPRDFFFVAESKREETIEAIAEETVLASYSGGRVELLAARDPQFARELREVALQSLTRSHEQLLILGGVTALEKVGSFLLSLDGRALDTRGQVELPVTRYDIAEYLAISVETVCRAITDLQQRGVITLVGKRTVKILNRGALEDRAGEKLKGLNRSAPSRLGLALAFSGG
jgi:CRP/FNR family transcriptional regulator, nitrogen fixation regulation protein